MALSKTFRRWATALLLLPAVAFANERQQGDTVRCFVALSLAAQDDFLSRQEYVAVVTNLSDGRGFGDSFQELPQVLQDNFNALADNSGDFINVRGVRQGNGGSTDFVERFCWATRVAIGQARVDSLNPEGEPPDGNSAPFVATGEPENAASGGPPDLESTSSPSVSPASLAPSTSQASFTPRPTRPLNQCYVGMITSDDDFDKRLSRAEYVSFVQFLKPGSYEGLQFTQLPAPLKDNFDELRSNNVIYIAGLPRPSDEQAVTLQRVCDYTNAAISLDCCLPSPTVQPTTYPSISPSMAPSISVQPSNPPKEVVSQFVVSNSVGLSAQQLNMPGNARRRQMDNAYDSLVEAVVSATTGPVNIFGREWHAGNRGQTRRLVVDYAGGSTKFYVDSECPAGTVTGAMCQQVVASFFLEISQDENVTDAVDRVQAAVSSSIASGDLQSRLADLGSPIMVEEGAPIVNQPSGLPSLAPSMAPSAVPSIKPAARPSRSPAATPAPSAPSNGSRSASGGLSTPVIIGIAAGVAIALSLVLGVSVLLCSRRSRPQESKVVPDDEENTQHYGPKDGLQVSPSKSNSMESLPSSTGTGSKQPRLPIRQDSPQTSPPYLEC